MGSDEAATRYDVKLVKNLLIPMRDGTRLAADLHLPVGEGSFQTVEDEGMCFGQDKTCRQEANPAPR